MKRETTCEGPTVEDALDAAAVEPGGFVPDLLGDLADPSAVGAVELVGRLVAAAVDQVPLSS